MRTILIFDIRFLLIMPHSSSYAIIVIVAELLIKPVIIMFTLIHIDVQTNAFNRHGF